MKVIAQMDVLSINDKETEFENRPTIYLENSEHPTSILIVVEGTRFEVNGDDLLEAVKRVKDV